MTKLTTFLSVALAGAMLCGCGSPAAEEHKCVAPMPAAISVDNLRDCMVPAAFNPENFNWMGGNLHMTVYNQDLYDAVEIAQLQAGDTLIYNAYPIVIEKIEETGNGIEINGGAIDEGGCCLAANDGGTYVALHWDTHATYTQLGEAEVPLAEDFVIIDCGENPTDPSDTIRTDQKLYLENLTGGGKDFNTLNTLVTIEQGQITAITRRWIP